MLDSKLALNAGKIFIWNNYPFFECEEKDRRWFLFLGNCIITDFIFQVTTTTQTDYYIKGGRRALNNHFALKTGDGGLEKDCIIDLTMYYEKLPHVEINNFTSKIDPKTLLTQEKVNILVKHIVVDKDIIGIEKKTIYQCLRNSGFKINV